MLSTSTWKGFVARLGSVSSAMSPSEKGKRPQVTQGSFRLDFGKNVCTGRVARPRSNELVESLWMEVLRRCLDVALGVGV